MEISLDWKADALYIKFQEGRFAKNKRMDDDTIIDLDSQGRLLGIEILNVTQKVPAQNLSEVSVKTAVVTDGMKPPLLWRSLTRQGIRFPRHIVRLIALPSRATPFPSSPSLVPSR